MVVYVARNKKKRDAGSIPALITMVTETKEAQDAEVKKDEFYCSKDKFIKFLRFVGTVRDAQNTYFGKRNQANLRSAKALEKKLDEAIEFYLGNQDKLHDCPFVND